MSELVKKDFSNTIKPTWCPGCGNFGILTSLRNALANLDIPQEKIVIAGDVGCSSNLPNYMKTHTFCGLHGRVIPTASGIKLANHELTVIAVGGDGGIYGEGGNHFLHAARLNLDITLLVHDNQVYSLTKGQTSPTSEQGFHSSATPKGSFEPAMNPLTIALAAGASFVARGFAGDPIHLTDLIKSAINHPGFALIDILQPCVSFNNINTLPWYKQRIYKLETEKDYDNTDLAWAMNKAEEWGKRIPTGIFFEQQKSAYEKQLLAINNKPLINQSIERIDIKPLLTQFQ